MASEEVAVSALRLAARHLEKFDITLKTAMHAARLGQDIENTRPQLHALLDDYLDQYAIANRLGGQSP